MGLDKSTVWDSDPLEQKVNDLSQIVEDLCRTLGRLCPPQLGVTEDQLMQIAEDTKALRNNEGRKFFVEAITRYSHSGPLFSVDCDYCKAKVIQGGCGWPSCPHRNAQGKDGEHRE